VIHGLIDKVRVGTPPVDDAARYRQGASVTIRTRDGRSVTSTVYAPKGSGLLGIAWADIDAKFRALVPLSGMGERQIEAMLDIIHDLRRQGSVTALTDLLRGA
jgi:2-methylcitrate dehydratase PrpD